jgi:spermidine synthase
MKKARLLKQNGFNFLWLGKEIIMWDIPAEETWQKRLSKNAYGDVLVAGYGFGLLQKHLLSNPKVKSVTSVEIIPSVVKVAKELYDHLYGEVIVDDFFSFKSNKKYDCVIGDTWSGITPEALNEYKKFKKVAVKLVKTKGKIIASGEDYFEYLLKKQK